MISTADAKDAFEMARSEAEEILATEAAVAAEGTASVETPAVEAAPEAVAEATETVVEEAAAEAVEAVAEADDALGDRGFACEEGTSDFVGRQAADHIVSAGADRDQILREVQSEFAKKMMDCAMCEFFRRVKGEEGASFES